MALIRASIWPGLKGSLLSEFFDDNRFLPSPSLRGKSLPAVNVRETDKAYEVEVAAPGLDKSHFNITVDNGVLTISAEGQQETEKKGDNYTRREFDCVSFTRAFRLPVDTDDNDIQEKYEDGILRLTIAKKTIPEATSKKPIAIK